MRPPAPEAPPDTPPQDDDRGKRLRRRIIALLIVTLLMLVFVVPFALGIASLRYLTASVCGGHADPSAYGLAFEQVRFNANGEFDTNAYFIPGDSAAVVIIAPAFASDAGNQLPYAAMFHELGLGVLALEGRTCAGRTNTLGYLEGDLVTAGYAYLTTRDDVDRNRVSVHGFSAAGAAALFGAARTPELRGVSAMGNYHDFTDEFGLPKQGDGVITALYKLGANVTFRVSTGYPVSVLRPVTVIDEIVPRPILFIYGSNEPGLVGGREMAELAGDAAEFWEVPGVGHGGYLEAYPEETSATLGGFHVELLLTDETD